MEIYIDYQKTANVNHVFISQNPTYACLIFSKPLLILYVIYIHRITQIFIIMQNIYNVCICTIFHVHLCGDRILKIVQGCVGGKGGLGKAKGASLQALGGEEGHYPTWWGEGVWKGCGGEVRGLHYYKEAWYLKFDSNIWLSIFL